MKVAIVTTYSVGAPVSRVVSIINAFQGHEVHIIGANSKQNLESNPALENRQIMVHHIPLRNSSAKQFLFRFLNELLYAAKCSIKARSIKADREIVTIPFSSLIITSGIIRSRGTFQILDIRDLVWEYLKTGGTASKIIKFLFKRVHLYFAKRFNYITVTNPTEYKILKEDLGLSKIAIMPNGISEFSFNYLNNHAIEMPSVSNNSTIITYIGNVGLLQNLSTFIDAVYEMERFVFRIVGDGNDFGYLKKKIQERGTKNIELVGRVPYKDLISFYKSTHLLYAKLDKNISSAVPSKLYEYLAVGKPIIYSGKGAAITLLNDFENIFICNDDNEDIKRVLRNIDNSNFSISERNRQLIKTKFIREQIYKSYIHLS